MGRGGPTPALPVREGDGPLPQPSPVWEGVVTNEKQDITLPAL